MESHNEKINKDINSIYNLLDKNNMKDERESLDVVINGFNDEVDEVLLKVSDIVKDTESSYLFYTDFLYLFITLYCIYLSLKWEDSFGIIFNICILIFWSWRDFILKILTGKWKE